VRYADGWDVVAASVDDYAVKVMLVNRLCDELGRERPLRRQVQVFADELQPAAAAELVAGLASYGATTVIFVLHQNRGLKAIESLADAVLPNRAVVSS